LPAEYGDGVLQAAAAIMAGYPIAARAPAEEGRDLADAIGDRYDSHQCRYYLGWAQIYEGDLAGAAAHFAELAAEAKAAHDGLREAQSLAKRAVVLAFHGDPGAMRAAADAGTGAAAEVGGLFTAMGYVALAAAALAAGDAATALGAIEACPHLPGARRRGCSGCTVRKPRWRTGICQRPAAGQTKPLPCPPAFTCHGC
jgi:hypothetical protein